MVKASLTAARAVLRPGATVLVAREYAPLSGDYGRTRKVLGRSSSLDAVEWRLSCYVLCLVCLATVACIIGGWVKGVVSPSDSRINLISSWLKSKPGKGAAGI